MTESPDEHETEVVPVELESVIPCVTHWKGYSLDIFSHMAKERVLFLEETNEESARSLIAQMLYLSEDDPKRDIVLVVNHGGGDICCGLAIIDIMQHLKCDVATVSVGTSASMGAVILCSGTKGKRYALPNATVMMHQGRFQETRQGTASDLKIMVDEVLKLEDVINDLMVRQTGQPLEKIVQDNMRDFYLNAKEAKEYGLIDRIVTKWPQGIRE